MLRFLLVFLLGTAICSSAYAGGAREYFKGYEAMHAGDSEKAIKYFTIALAAHDLTPTFRPPGYLYRGGQYLLTNQYDAAIADFDRAIALRPDLAPAYSNRGIAYMFKGQHEKSVADHNEAIRLMPDLASNYVNRAAVYAAMGRAELALGDYQNAIRLGPKYDSGLFGPRVMYMKRRKSDSPPDVNSEEGVENEMNLSMAYNGVCYELAFLGRANEALPNCEKALQLNPDSAAILDSRAYAYFRLAEFSKALADYDAALKIKPDLAPSLYGRGVIRMRMGDTAGGNRDLLAAKAADPSIAEKMAKVQLTP